MLINRSSIAGLTTGFRATFQKAFDDAPSHYDRIAMVVPSSTSQEVYPWLGSTTRFREWVGDRVIQNLSTHDFTIKNRSYESTIGVDRDQIEDDQFGVYAPIIGQLGRDAKTHPDELIFDLLKNGFTHPCYDGQYFFDPDHLVVGENGVATSASNYQPGWYPPWYLLDLTKTVRPLIFQKRKDYQFVAMDQPTDDVAFSTKQFRYGVDARVSAGYGLWQMAYASKAELNEATLSAAIAAMSSLKGDNGKPLGITPSLLLVPPVLRDTALRLIKAETINGTTNINRDAVEVLSTPWLA